ncbi:MAG TPA: HAD family phosphatase [Nitrospirota bacterium]|nr:HAD family phosphatase [Nitrospirota bacterium]
MLIDFGGVIAEEGFYEGLLAIGRKNGIDPLKFFEASDGLIAATGYLTGAVDESDFWNEVRRRTGVAEDDASLRREILSRFVLRQDMLDQMDCLREQGLTVAMLSDQTNWLEEIDAATGLFRHFDRVFNSYRLHKSKRDASVFRDVCAALGVRPEETLFVDDNRNHIRRAESQGLRTFHFTRVRDFTSELNTIFKGAQIDADERGCRRTVARDP